MRTREFKQLPYVWQSKDALHLIRQKAKTRREAQMLTLVYLAMTEIASDHVTKSNTVCIEDICRYSNINRRTVGILVTRLEEINICQCMTPCNSNAHGKYAPNQHSLKDVIVCPWELELHNIYIYNNTNNKHEENIKPEENTNTESLPEFPLSEVPPFPRSKLRFAKHTQSAEQISSTKQEQPVVRPEVPGKLEPETPVTLTPVQQKIFDKLSEYSRVRVPSFLKIYSTWVSKFPVDQLLSELDAWDLYWSEGTKKPSRPLTSFTNWLTNSLKYAARSPAPSSQKATSHQNTARRFPSDEPGASYKKWTDVTDYSLASDFHKDLIVQNIKAGTLPPSYQLPANLPKRYVDIFNKSKDASGDTPSVPVTGENARVVEALS